jgi:PAS domain S-box-containing protein
MKLRTVIFLTAVALGILPILTLVAINLHGHIARHEQVSNQQVETMNMLSHELLQQLTSELRQDLFQAASLPEVLDLVRLDSGTFPSAIPMTSPMTQERLSVLFTEWFNEKKYILGLAVCNRSGQEKLTFVRSTEGTLEKTAPQHEKKEHLSPAEFSAGLIKKFTRTEPLRLLISVPINDLHNINSGYLRAEINLSSFLKNYKNGLWLDAEQLVPVHQSIQGENKISSIPGKKSFAANTPFVWADSENTKTAWLPISLADGKPLIWIGTSVDVSKSRQWKRSLIINIIWIVGSLTVIVFIIAQRLAAHADSIKEDILSGLDRILNKKEAVQFNWNGPRELRDLANELTSVSEKFSHANQARKQAEQELQQSEEKFRNLTASAQDAIILMDHHGRINFWNRAAVNTFGYSIKEAIDKPVYELISPRLAESGELLTGLNDSADGPIRETVELTALKKNGSRIPIELSLAEAKLDDQLHAIWIIRDISERKEAAAKEKEQQQRLIQADKMISIGLLVSGVAHEINNPNSIAMLNIPMLNRAWKSITPILERYYEENGDFMVAGLDYSEMREQVPRLFSELAESSKRIKNIVKDLKDYARQDTSRHLDPLDLNDVIKAAVRLTYNQIKKNTDNFSVTYADNLPLIKGNKQRLEQIIINLIQNSCESLPDKQAFIAVSTEYMEEENIVIARVRDGGVGIQQEDLHKITDPFYTTKRTAGGTGLGLSVSVGIMKEHNGLMGFESVPGKGTTVTLRFPTVEPNEDTNG